MIQEQLVMAVKPILANSVQMPGGNLQVLETGSDDHVQLRLCDSGQTPQLRQLTKSFVV